MVDATFSSPTFSSQVKAGPDYSTVLKSVAPVPLTKKDLLALSVDGLDSFPTLSFAWWAAAKGLVETADFWTPLLAGTIRSRQPLMSSRKCKAQP